MLFRSCSFSGDTDDYSGRMGSTTHMMRCLGCNNFKFDFVPYGCRCRHEKRKSVIGNPVDVIDWCCLHHQRCYKSRHGEGCHALTHYRWSCVAGNLHCLSGQRKDLCHVARHKCDSQLALCLFPYPVWEKYRNHSLQNCSRNNQCFVPR
ncbi:neutral phospholipase A2 homolog taipoxin beta chain 2-like isoform X1 [Mobula birostris]|uniref:neutral phospholipase A2 homolog taipoxin beta chain 2-like isoform X1 n=1 Tax=Mobula birostris TaxID=1983395 RepID=UPI003B2862E7